MDGGDLNPNRKCVDVGCTVPPSREHAKSNRHRLCCLSGEHEAEEENGSQELTPGGLIRLCRHCRCLYVEKS